MPFYEYQCSACGAQVEVLQKISDAPLKRCPECGKSKLSKLVSAPVFRLKGGGKEPEGEAKPAAEPAKAVDAGKDEAKAEKKTEDKTTKRTHGGKGSLPRRAAKQAGRPAVKRAAAGNSTRSRAKR